MAEFVLARTFRFISGNGHSVQFEKGVPTYVPIACHREVQEIGAVPLENVEPILGYEKEAVPELSFDDRRSQLIAAFKRLQDRNAREDFTGQGVPSVTALRKIVDFSIDRKEIEALWREYIEGGDE